MSNQYLEIDTIRSICGKRTYGLCIASDLDNDILRKIVDVHRTISNPLTRIITIVSNNTKIKFSDIPEPITPFNIYFSRFRYTLIARNIPSARKILENEEIDTILLIVRENPSSLTGSLWYEYLEGYYKNGKGIIGLTYILPHDINYSDSLYKNKTISYSYVDIEKLENILKNLEMLIGAYT